MKKLLMMNLQLFNVGAGDTWSLPNYAGDLFTADAESTAFLTMIGGLTGGLQSTNFEFPTDSLYAYPTAAQPAITETASLTAPTAISYTRSQEKNVTQIFHEQVSISYEKMSNGGRLQGINTVGAKNNAPSEKDFQKATALKKIARDIEFSFLQGAYAISTGVGVANKTRGMLAAAALGSTIAAGGATNSKALMQNIFRTMFAAGAIFENVVLFMNAFQKQVISDIYGYAPEDRNVGGVNIKTIETDFGVIGIAAASRFMPTDTVGIFEISKVAPVFQPVPEKGNFFYEELSKTGAAESGQIYGKIGLDHGPSFLHGSITGLATA